MSFGEVSQEFTGNWSKPAIIGGKKCFIAMSRSGEITLRWSRWGEPLDYAGIYMPPQRLIGPLTMGIYEDGGIIPLSRICEKAKITPIKGEFNYSSEKTKIHKIIYPSEEEPSTYIQIQLKSNVKASFLIGIEPYLGYTEYEGLIPEELQIIQRNSNIMLSAPKFNFYGAVTINPKPREVNIGGLDIAPPDLFPNPTKHPKCVKRILLEFQLNPNTSQKVELAIAGSLSSLKDAQVISSKMLEEKENQLNFREKIWTTYWITQLDVKTPDRQLSKAFQLAKWGLNLLKARQDNLIGVYAGLPWFANFWGRDLAQTLPALIHLGDHQWVKLSLQSILRYQAKHDYPQLGARKGEIPMFYGKGFPLVYGTPDSTLYYPTLILEYCQASADFQYLRESWKKVKMMIEWGYDRDIDGDSLLEHKPSSPIFEGDATWMDTEYRGIKAIEIQALWVKALESAYKISRMLGLNQEKLRETAEKVKREIAEKYWNKNESYLYDRIDDEGNPISEVRCNALLALALKVLPENLGAKAVKRALQEDLLTSWGIRTLSQKDPKYDPKSYQSGQVWPLVTGWAARAAYQYGLHEEALQILEIMAKEIVGWKGMYPETYRGDKAEPHISCIIQAWSLSQFIQPLIEGLLGIKVEALQNTVKINPKMPEKWSTVIVKNLKAGGALLNLKIEPSKEILEAENIGVSQIKMTYKDRTAPINPGEKIRLKA